jgi:protein-tyrosine phosphatase
MKAVHFPIHDFNETDLVANLWDSANIINDMINKENRVVYVHCTAGMGRAPACVLAYLCLFKKVPCWSDPTEVDKLVKSYRKVSVPNLKAVWRVFNEKKG